jgi:hypothetical protein
MTGIQRGREPGTPKTGGITKGSVMKQTLAVRAAILRVFEDFNENDDYLKDLAENDRKLFLGLLTRVIPQAQEIEVDQRVTIDLGAAMAEADKRAKEQAIARQAAFDVVTVRPPATQADAERIYGTPGEQPLPDPQMQPDLYLVDPQDQNRELWVGYNEPDLDPKPRRRRRRTVD